MEADLQAHVAFFLTGKTDSPDLDAIDKLGLRPALYAAYRDLSRLRYDFPLLLVDAPSAAPAVESLSGLIDGILDKIAHGGDGDRVRQQVLRLEQSIRALACSGRHGRLSELWEEAAAALVSKDKSLADSLSRARANLKLDGMLVDCDATLPFHLVGHAWAATQTTRARRFTDLASRLVLKLADILEAGFANSNASRTASNLQRTFGTGPMDRFDFDAMSRLLSPTRPKEGLSKNRRRRVENLLSTLQTQKFFPAAGSEPYAFAFDSCRAALAAYRERLPKAIELARTLAVADLEVKGEYNEERHGPIFNAFGENGLDLRDLSLFPDYLVRIPATRLQGNELDALTEILSANLPIKVLVQTDDILEESTAGGHFAFSLRSRQLANMALGMNDVFVLQTPAAGLYALRASLQRGLEHTGPALFSVFSGAVPGASLPAYLVAAAALESRAFPAFVMDPAAGTNWASRFSLAANPQPEADWPSHRLAYEDRSHQSVARLIPFTLADFVAGDRRFGKFFVGAAQSLPADALCAIDEAARSEPGGIDRIASVPALPMVDSKDRLQHVVVSARLVRETRRCLSMWKSLQELGGIRNSHAEKLLAQEKAAWEASACLLSAASVPVAAPPAADSPVAAAAVAEAAPAEAAKNADEAYIETPRCASCNECIQISDKMFAYDGNKQAFIKDINAGSYAQLVEAAENCQVAIIHPGKPRNPNEAGLDELVKRAEAFL